MGSRDGELRVFMVAGEVSGDAIASRLMSSLRKISPFPLRFAGVGGALMSQEGLQSLYPLEDIAVMGIWELLPHLNQIRRKLKETTEAALLFRPHVVVTVDSKGFSFRFLKLLRASCGQQGVESPVHIHYVAPSFWAWKGGEKRLEVLSSFVDHVLCILPFEEDVCRSNGLAATFVGHPLLDDASSLNLKMDPLAKWKVHGNDEGFRIKYGIPSGAMVITLLPGSRLQEHVERYINRAIHKWTVPTILIPGGSQNLKYDAFSASRAALSTSGTAILELQLARLPCVAAYRAHFITEWFIKWRTKLQYMTLPNILLESHVIPEALFQACTPKNLASLVSQLIQDDHLRRNQTSAAAKHRL
ncbi:hypothetical protein MRB53_016927 [Persea americana]|uniref:Uncharacterized protein n=1 Tax=Persea americana TaxID=3435 RepID=A0ACC2M480_PERAE|nr:hypothetical protein MRB53_016927 [Persea americana]